MLKWLSQYTSGYKTRKQKYDVSGANASPERTPWNSGLGNDPSPDRALAVSRHDSERDHDRRDSKPHQCLRLLSTPHDPSQRPRDLSPVGITSRGRSRGISHPGATAVKSGDDPAAGCGRHRSSRSAAASTGAETTSSGADRRSSGADLLSTWAGRRPHLVVEYASDDSPERRPRRLSPSAEQRFVSGAECDDEFFIICPPSVAGEESGPRSMTESSLPVRDGQIRGTFTDDADTSNETKYGSVRPSSSYSLLEKLRRRHDGIKEKEPDRKTRSEGYYSPSRTATGWLSSGAASAASNDSGRKSRLDQYEHYSRPLVDPGGAALAKPTRHKQPPKAAESSLHGPSSIISEDNGVTRICVSARRSRSEGAASEARYLSTSLPRQGKCSEAATDRRWVLTLPIRPRLTPDGRENGEVRDSRGSRERRGNHDTIDHRSAVAAAGDTRSASEGRRKATSVNSADHRSADKHGVAHRQTSDKIHVRMMNRVTRDITHHGDVPSHPLRSKSLSLSRPDVTADITASSFAAKHGAHVITNGSLSRVAPRQSRHHGGESDARRANPAHEPAIAGTSRPELNPLPPTAVTGHSKDDDTTTDASSSQSDSESSRRRSASFRLSIVRDEDAATKRVTIVPRRTQSEPRNWHGPETNIDDDVPVSASSSYAHIATFPRALSRRPRRSVTVTTQTSPQGTPEPEPRRAASEQRRCVDDKPTSLRPRSASVDSADLGRICRQALIRLQEVAVMSGQLLGSPHTPKSVSDSALTPEGREHLMWCTDEEFDRALEQLSQLSLLELIQLLQDAMLIEQQTFDSLQQQLEAPSIPAGQRHRLSAALCTSQTRLTRLCGRSMRCFTQQAMRARQRVADRPENPGTSPPSDTAGNLSTNFRENLSFFQKAAQNLSRAAPPARARPPARRSSVGSDGSSSVASVASADAGDEEDFEPVLFVNGRPRYMTSEPSGAAIGGASPAVESDAPPDRAPETSGGARTEWSAATVGGGQKVRIGGTAAERIRAGSRGGSADRLSHSKSPVRTSREQETSAGRSSSADSGIANLREKASSSAREKTSSSSREKTSTSSREKTSTSSREKTSSSSREKTSSSSRERSSVSPSKREKSSSPSSGTSSKRDKTPRDNSPTGTRDGSSSSKRDTFTDPNRDRAESVPQQSTEEVQPPRRKPYIRFSSVECQNHLSHDDLTYFKQTIGIVSGGGITRTQSCQEGLNSAPPRPTVSRTLSVSSLADVGAEPRSLTGSRSSLRRAPSVEEILESVKALRARRAGLDSNNPTMVRSSEPEVEYQNVTSVSGGSTNGTASSSKSRSSSKGRATPWSGVQFSGPVRSGDPDEGYENADDACYENVSGGQAVYQNSPLPAKTPAAEVIYDQPVQQRRKKRNKTPEDPQQLYENVQFSEPTTEYQNVTQPTYTNLGTTPASGEADTVYENVEKGPVVVSGNGVVAGTYDVPRTASHIYDAPQRTRVKNVPAAEAGEYDAPRPTYGPGGRASAQGEAAAKAAARPTQIVVQGDAASSAARGKDSDCDRDSLDGETTRRPDIPSPDYGSDAEDVDGIPNDYIGDDQLDEGLGESDARSYYNEDPGLEVILEEPEDEYVTSSEEEEEPAQRRSLRSLEGSEGIGSAEGDSGSNASVESSSGVHSSGGSPTLRPTNDEREERIQRDRCVEVYPETMRQRKQAKKLKQQASAESKQQARTDGSDGKSHRDVSNASMNNNNGSKAESPSKIKKLLPSVKALKSQFENNSNTAEAPKPRPKDKSPSPPKQRVPQQVTLPAAEQADGSTSAASDAAVVRQTSPQRTAGSNRNNNNGNSSSNGGKKVHITDDPVDIIYDKFAEVDERLLKQRITTLSWDPTSLVSRLYDIPQPASRATGEHKGYVNIEGWLEKLPSGRKKATFWNAWKRRYFKAKDGFLYYYQTNTTEKPSMVLQLMGGNVEAMDSSVIGVDDGVPQMVPMLSLDDGKGHYVVVRCSSRPEADRWSRALLSHTVEDYNATYVQPVMLPQTVACQRRCVVIDLGSSSIRAGVLHDQPTLPQLFFPAVMVTSREGKQATFGSAALHPEVRASGVLSFPLRPSSKITKYSVDVPALAGLLQLTFRELRVDPSDYCVQLSLPRSFNTATLGEILRLLFEKFGAQGVNLTHQSILAMWSYNATSGVVVDVGDRMDVVPVIDGYIVEGGVSRVPYGGVRIQDHLRHFLLQKHYSLVTEVESFVLRYVLERLCYVSERYSSDMETFSSDPASLEKTLSVKEFLGDSASWKRVSLDAGRFQAAEGLFRPDAWGLDNKGVHKLVHKAVQECSVDIRKEMVRSIYLAGGVTLLPGFAERLQIEMDKLTPASVTPKVHASPYRYHAAYLGACVLAGSEGFQQAMVARDSWLKLGINALKKWTV